MRDPFTIGDETQPGSVTVASGERGFGHLLCGYLPGGEPLTVPLIVVNGGEDGPILWLNAMLNGNEQAGFPVIRRITREVVDPLTLRGAIVALPVANPLAFRSQEARTPEDGFELQDVFPGDPHGTLTERMAHTIFHQAVLKCDAVVDLHSPSFNSIEWAAVVKPSREEVWSRSLALGRAFGFPMSQVPGDMIPNALILKAQEAGIPAIIVEILWPRVFSPASVEHGVRGVLNVMAHLGMVDSSVEPQSHIEIGLGPYGLAVAKADASGILHILKQPGDAVEKDDVLALVHAPYGDVSDRVRSPCRGIVRTYGFQAVTAGQVICAIMATEA